MTVYLWPSDMPTLAALAARIREIRAAGDTPGYDDAAAEHLARLLYEAETEAQ